MASFAGRALARRRHSSRATLLALARMSRMCIMRAGTDDAAAVAEFLARQDVRPAPNNADVATFVRRAGATVWCALRDGRIDGVAACITDGSVLRVAYFALAPEREDLLTGALMPMLERSAHDAGAAVLAAQSSMGSQTHRCLARCGFSVEWEEGDAGAGTTIAIVELVKAL